MAISDEPEPSNRAHITSGAGQEGEAKYEFSLLGPLTVRRAGSPLDLGPRKRRVLLIRLLMENGRPVRMDRLCDDLWDGRPPPSAVSSVHAHISRLRSVLEPGRGARARSDVLVSGPTGYALRIPPEARDTVRFERSVNRGRRLLSAGDAHGARTEIERALLMWRGAALADAADHAFAASEVARLDDVRLAAQQVRVNALIEAGDTEQAVVAAEELTAATHLRETAWALLIRALYLSGRTLEALQRYERFRALLAEDFGLEPGPELRAIQQAILRHDTSALEPPTRHLTPTPSATTTASDPQQDHEPPRPDAPPDELPSPAGSDAEPAPEPESAEPEVKAAPDTDIASPLPGAEGACPAQLPADLATFTGRRSELTHVLALLPEDGRPTAPVVISAIDGMAGIGKTTLAVHLAHRVAHRFPDGQLFVDLRGFGPEGSAVTPADAVRGFLEAFGVPPQRIPAGLDAQAALYRSLVVNRRVLVVLDNARDAEQVRPLLPGAPGCLVVITSRNHLQGLVAANGAHPLTLGLLTLNEARDTLINRLGAERVAAEPRAVAEIISMCSRLPLALAIVAAHAVAHPTFSLASTAAVLRQSHGSLDSFEDMDAVSNVRTVFSWSYRALTPAAARLFRLLALHPGPDVSRAAAAGLAGLSVSQLRPLLAELTGAHLLIHHRPCRYVFHDLLRAYAGELLAAEESEDERRAALDRMLGHYLHTAHAAANLIASHREMPHPGPVGEGVTPEELADRRCAMDWFAAEHAVLMAVVGKAVETGFDSYVWQIAWTMQPYLDWRGHWYDQIAVQLTALAATRRKGGPSEQARIHRDLGGAYAQLNRFDNARVHLYDALALYTAIGNGAAQGRVRLNLTFTLHRQGRDREALAQAQQALALYQAAGHRPGAAESLAAIGWCHTMLGDHEQAIASCRLALPLLRELDHVRGQAGAWNTMGHAHHRLGNDQSAVICYEQAVSRFRFLKDNPNEAGTLVRLGDALRAAHDPEAARTAWLQALVLLEDLDRSNADEVRARLNSLDHPGPDTDDHHDSPATPTPHA
ncbi:BTAD domain-containing putative transcriptional regulator [Streptomyces sp. yr375]|uniref:AfsR/SARP family transcriptional regulator n=1 Tax=Streptomyces sp. yr375 TaxID=1761906 RepID=UPI0015A71AE3|nr:BTAD domain-containing putative transcriptional regulator [Streptomyces sp. yr375]